MEVIIAKKIFLCVSTVLTHWDIITKTHDNINTLLLKYLNFKIERIEYLH